MSISVGDIVNNRFNVLHKLTTRKTAIIWLVKDNESSRYLILKAIQNFSSIQDPPCGCQRGTTLLPGETEPVVHPGQYSVSPIVDSFIIDGGENNDTLGCTVYPLLGQDITALAHPGKVSFPWELLRRITMHLLLALEYIHTIKGIVHTDIHYDNILIQPNADEIPSIVEKFLAGIEQNPVEKPILFPLIKADKTYITLIDFDTAHSSANADKHAFLIQPDHLRAPEVTIGAHWGSPADIWNLGCLVYEMATSRHLFTADIEGQDPTAQLGHIVSALGDFPLEFLKSGQYWAKYFTEDGKLKRDAPTHLPLTALIYWFIKEDPNRPDHPDLEDEDLADFMDFLMQMICIKPEDRLTAGQLLKHDWMQPALRQYAEELTKKFGSDGSEEQTSK